VRIADTTAFFTALDEAVRTEMVGRGRHLEPLQVGACRYIDRSHGWYVLLPQYWLLKPSRYQHQAEIRAAWAVDEGRDLTALLVQSRAIARSCDDAV
jgi:hypothetical protein